MKRKDWIGILSGVSDLCAVKQVIKANRPSPEDIDKIREILANKNCFVPDVDAGVTCIPMFNEEQIAGICDEVISDTA